MSKKNLTPREKGVVLLGVVLAFVAGGFGLRFVAELHYQNIYEPRLGLVFAVVAFLAVTLMYRGNPTLYSKFLRLVFVLVAIFLLATSYNQIF